MSSTTRQRVGVVASDPLRALGLISILEDAFSGVVIPMELEDAFGPKSDGMAALVLDARVAGTSADMLTEMIERLRKERPDLRIVVMDSSLEPDHVQSVIAAGAKGYLPETAVEGEIRMALEVVLDGSIWAPRKVLARLIERRRSDAPVIEVVASKMSKREAEVLELLLLGRSNRDIATVLGIDEVTVKAHLGRMLRKTGSSNRVELTLKALEEKSIASASG